ncbi:MAG: ClC family H(+)/Cl(-) exchange transporter, partial [Clostridiales bacterium]|nr:ClC family H(+)/Cl(-) exchange transporter [Clostridiales bacterium]
VFTMICFCSGAPGGIFFPLLVLGALLGGIMGSIACSLLGLPESCMINFLMLGMTGMFSGIVRAPLTGIVLVAEMTGSLTQFTGLVIVSIVSALTANMLGSKPIYDELLENMLKK